VKYILPIVISIFLYSCNSRATISKEEISSLKEEVKLLNDKIDSLEEELRYSLEMERLLTHDSILFSYKKTPCLGSCPVFKFSVYKDGWATYEGKNYVDLIGVYTARLSQEEMNKLHRIFQAAYFYSFRARYDDNRLDIPSMIVEYHGSQGVKKVVAKTEIPHSFRKMTVDLEEFADEIIWEPAE
jgi:hypothetical protein